MISKYIQEVSDWFIIFKAPDLKDKVAVGLKIIDEGKQLEGMHKKLFGFMLFSFAMNHGPASFIGIELLAEDLSVIDEFKEYAKDWIGYSKNKADAMKTEP